MIEWAGCSVAMVNVIPEVREIAIFKQNQHGVAHAVQELVLKK